MGKNKLKKFAEMETFDNVFQYPFAVVERDGFPLKGRWKSDFFKNDNPIVLELGCGKGEYAVGLARRFPEKNYIGVDIKGARMWTGAKSAVKEGISNVAFLRTNIELITRFFEPGEVSEIWITFPDPQMKKVRKRLTSSRFLDLYREILVADGIVHLKTDSPFLYTYTDALVKLNNMPTEVNTSDLYHSDIVDDILEIKTFYEQQWLDRGLTIKYIKFHLDHTTQLQEPDIEIEEDTYRSFSRGYIQCPQLLEDENNEE
jgi:tRNA (guanine-N7-)-methyltransferase